MAINKRIIPTVRNGDIITINAIIRPLQIFARLSIHILLLVARSRACDRCEFLKINVLHSHLYRVPGIKSEAMILLTF